MEEAIIKPNTQLVEYVDMREDIESGDLLAWSTDNTSWSSSLLTMIVRFFTLSEFSHVGIAYREDGRVYVLEATIPQIQLRPLSEVKGFYHIPMRIQWDLQLQDYLKHFVGKPYSIIDCIRGYLGKTDVSDDRWQCAEVCNDFFRHANIELGDAYTPSKVVRESLSVRRSTLIFVG